MLDEYVLVPDIFDQAAYSNPAFIEMCLPHLKEPLFQEALVRDLCDGGWARYCMANSGNLHRLCREIVRKLDQKNRLVKCPMTGHASPAAALDWCNEGVSSASAAPLNGIIVGHATKQAAAFAGQQQVASIERLTASAWWQARSPSVTLDRKTPEYLGTLKRILTQANSLMFIDPYLDPSALGYREFHQLLAPLASRNPTPRIELHRTFNKGWEQAPTPTEEFWKQRFSSLHTQLAAIGLSAEVFIWSEFHDRHLIADVIGITASAGFDVTNRPDDMTTWSRMGRESKENIERKFDPANHPRWRFTIG